MLATPPGLTFSAYAVEVNDMVDDGCTLAEVEGAMRDAELTEDSKAALWLLAWSAPRRDARCNADGRRGAEGATASPAARVVPFRRG